MQHASLLNKSWEARREAASGAWLCTHRSSSANGFLRDRILRQPEFVNEAASLDRPYEQADPGTTLTLTLILTLPSALLTRGMTRASGKAHQAAG